MKKIITALAIAGLVYSAQAQDIKVCGTKSDKVCRPSSHGRSCYKTAYAENFKVCKGEFGYFICCETPNSTNSTHPVLPLAAKEQNYDRQYNYANVTPPVDMTVPLSQSYVVTSSNTYEGYYPRKGQIKVCYTGDNVAEENRAPYEGCPSPASEGPEVNRQRNVNVSNPEAMPPSGGQPMQ